MINKSPVILKQHLLKMCMEMQLARIENARKAMQDAQQSANEEERSTAGDKYDTSRAMSQNVRDMNAKQLQEALKDIAILQQINPDFISTEVKLGSVVRTTAGNYFIAISGITYKADNETYVSVSTSSPVGQLMLTKRKGDTFIFKEKSISILEAS